MAAAQVENAPAAQPIFSVEELLSWQPGSLPSEEECIASVSLPARSQDLRDLSSKPRLLVCHDHRGGYTEDRWAAGSPNTGAYRINAWHCIDTFVYFSHHLVTIPPPGWINAAHTNGVPVLGTFITEWDAGSDSCASAFASQSSAEEVAVKLAALAERYGFEGWLINIENTLDPALVQNLLHFLRTLHDLLHRQPSAQLIWYDAVTMDGELDWQNTLNDRNRPFFDACDALFVNYTWKEGTPVQAAAEAGSRAADVYMGVDVFGRGTFGGGGLTCNVAIRAAFDAGLSAALFAPGWVHEVTPEDAVSKPYQVRQQEFWDSIECCCSGSFAAGRRHSLPFQSDFNPGCHPPHEAVSPSGLESPTAFPEAVGFNLSRQAVQPRWLHRQHSQALTCGMEPVSGRPWSLCSRVHWSCTGDCGLCVEGELPADRSISLGELFRLNAPTRGGLHITACLREEQCCVLLKLLLLKDSQQYTVLLAPPEAASGDTAQYNHRGGYSSNPSSSSPSLSSSMQSTSAEDGSAAADLVVFPCLHNDDTDEHSKEHGQNQHAGHFPLLSHKVCEETRVWTMNAEMVQRSTLVSVNIDIMCRAIKQPMMEESNVLVQAMLGALHISDDS